jgi:hypothetical protein
MRAFSVIFVPTNSVAEPNRNDEAPAPTPAHGRKHYLDLFSFLYNAKLKKYIRSYGSLTSESNTKRLLATINKVPQHCFHSNVVENYLNRLGA